MELEILKSEVFKEVEKRSSLEAAGIPDSFEQLWASEYEGNLLDTYWIEGCTSVIQLFKRYIRNETVAYSLTSFDADEELSISAGMPARFNELLEGSITTAVKMMIASGVMYGWMKIKLPGQAEKYKQEAAAYADDLRLKLLYRSEPSSTMTGKTDDDETINAGSSNEGMVDKANDRIAIRFPSGDEGMINKGYDRLTLKQYEKCDDCFKP